MKDLKKREIKKIEDKLSDMEVSDGVLDAARAEIAKSDKIPRRLLFNINYKIALSCAASFILCLAVIVPVSLSAISDKSSPADPPDSSVGDSSPPAPESKYFVLNELEKESFTVENPDGTEAIKKLSYYKYSYGGTEIISEENYSVYGSAATVYILHLPRALVDVLERFTNFESEYDVGGLAVKYKLDSSGYFAEAYFNGDRCCFAVETTQKQIFEEFCGYIFK